MQALVEMFHVPAQAPPGRAGKDLQRLEILGADAIVVDRDLGVRFGSKRWPFRSTASNSLKTFVPRPLIAVLPVPSEQTKFVSPSPGLLSELSCRNLHYGASLLGGQRGRSCQSRDGWPSHGSWTAVVFLPVPPPAMVEHGFLSMFTSRNDRLSVDVMRQLRDGSPSQV